MTECFWDKCNGMVWCAVEHCLVRFLLTCCMSDVCVPEYVAVCMLRLPWVAPTSAIHVRGLIRLGTWGVYKSGIIFR